MKLLPATSAPWGDVREWLMPEGGGAARIHGSAHVCGSARVYDSARVCDSAWVCGEGDIRSTADYMVLQCVGRDMASLTLHRDRAIGVRINRGCFSGTLDEFMARLESDNPNHDFYRTIVPIMEAELRRRMTPLEAQA